MFSFPSIGLAEVFILVGCAGGVLLIGAIVVAVIVMREKQGGDPLNEARASEKRGGAMPTRLRYILFAFALLIALGVFFVLDFVADVSIYVRFVAAYAAFWVLAGALLLQGTALRYKLLILVVFLAMLWAVRFIDWNSRKPFVKDLYRVQEGMTEAQVERIMGPYIEEAILPVSLSNKGDEADEPTLGSKVFYRHTDKSWGSSEWGVVTFEDGRVVQAEFIGAGFSSRSTPPGANVAGGGVGQTSYVFLRWKEGLALMMWHDFVKSSAGKGTGSTADPIYQYRGHAESLNGRRFGWEVQTVDGRVALFTIDGTRYDPADGALFIVTTENGKTEVRQLDRDLSGVQSDRESIIAFARGDPDVTRFVGEALNAP